MDGLVIDLRAAVRQLRSHPGAIRRAGRRLLRAPGFSVAALVTLTLGLGGAAAVFAVVNGVLLEPLPYPDPQRLVNLSHTLAISGLTRVNQSDATYLVYKSDNRVFTDVGLYREAAVNLMPAAGGGPTGVGAATPERVSAGFVTGSVFGVLGARAVRGRTLSAADGQPGALPVVVLSNGLWRRAFGGDPRVLGRNVAIDGVEREVVGVMPARFDLPDATTSLWVPVSIDPAHTRSAAFDYHAVARLRPGVTPARAAADLQRLLPTVPVVYPGRLTAGAITATHMRAVVRPLRELVVGDIGKVLWVVLGAVAVLLLIACVNVANLFLARAETRQRDMAVHRALGAGATVLAAEYLWEAALLVAAGAVLGLAAAAIGLHVLRSLPAAARIPRLGDVRVDGPVVAITVLAAAVAALGVSLVPALRARSVSLAEAMRGGGRGATAGRRGALTRRGLVTAQVALALLLLAGAGLLARSFQRLRAVDPGFSADQALSFRLALPPADAPDAGAIARTAVRTLDALRALPGVRDVGAVTQLPLDPEGRQDSAVFVEDRPLEPGQIPGIHEIVFATPGYFQAMHIPFVAGRLFAPPDAGGDPTRQPREVVVSRALADRYWPGGNAIGKRVRMSAGDPWSTIVGVVGSVHDAGLEQPAGLAVYVPLVNVGPDGTPWAPRDIAFVVRATGDAAALTGAVRAAVERVAPALPVFRVTPLAQLVSAAMARTSFTLLLLAIAAVIALGIGAAGIYGVISYLVSRRTRELGIRMALGARPGTVRGLVVREAVGDAALGVLAGLAAAAVLTRALGALLFHIGTTDPLALGGAAIVLLATATAASWVPARRAAAVDPATALRAE